MKKILFSTFCDIGAGDSALDQFQHDSSNFMFVFQNNLITDLKLATAKLYQMKEGNISSYTMIMVKFTVTWGDRAKCCG